MKISKFKVIISIAVAVVILIILLLFNHYNTVEFRKNHTKKVYNQFISLSEDFISKGYIVRDSLDSDYESSPFLSDGSNCFDLDLVGSTCAEMYVKESYVNKKVEPDERNVIVNILKNEGYEDINQEMTDSFLGSLPNSSGYGQNYNKVPIYELWMKSSDGKQFINVEYINKDFSDAKIFKDYDTVYSSMEITLHDFVLMEDILPSWYKSNIEM